MKKHQYLFNLLTVCLWLLATGGMAFAQEEGEKAERAEWNFQTSGNYDISSGKTISSKITLSGNLTLTATKAVTIKRGSSFNDYMFVTNGHTLTIKGASDKVVTIDGGSRTGVNIVILMGDGGNANNKCNLTYVTIQNNLRNMSGNATGSAIYGGGTVVCNNCVFKNNQSQFGGAVFVGLQTASGSPSSTFTNCEFINNKAQWGGAICVFRNGTVTVKGGKIIQNTASQRGGGIFVGNYREGDTGSNATQINNNAEKLILEDVIIGGSSTDKNTVTGGDGGGVYIHGSTSSGNFYCGQATMSGCTITHNTATGSGGGVHKIGHLTVSGKMIVNNNSANNVYITTSAGNKYVSIAAAGLSCGSSIGVYNANTYSSNTLQIASGTAANCLYAYRNKFFFDDQAASQVFNKNTSPYYDGNAAALYFVKNATANTALNSWHNQSATAGTDYVLTSGFVSEVKTAAGMAYFSKDVLTKDYSGKTVTLTADIDLSGHNWEPIGYMNDCEDNSGMAFKGTFDGQWHTIKGISCPYQYYNIGLFGCVDGGTITNTFVQSGTLSQSNADNIGGLVGWLKSGTISNSEAAVTMTGGSGTNIGGLVGEVTTGTIHSCSAMPTISGGTTKGGLVGSNGGTVSNSFANVTLSTSTTVGGLIGSNSGTLTNCYVRGTASFTGTTTTGTVTYCYGPSGTTVSGSNGVYTNPVAPYLYTRTNDNTVNGTSLLALLNDHKGNGAAWKRTTAGAYSSGAGNINGDFPVHNYANTKCVASTDGIVLDYAANLDAMLTRHTSNTTVNLYAHDNTSKATGSGVVVYIDENISLLQSDDTKDIVAYTCQVLPGTTRSWHFLSSSLSNSGIGFNYGTTSQVPFSWAENPCNVTFSTTDDQALYPSDVPNINKVDLYAFYEPEYHWINLKRNSNSHWHMNAHEVPIAYPNETTLTPGKGYLVSIDQDQLLQNKGILNNGDVSINLDYTPSNAWAGLLGYNLIGNPYQSYLDFSGFASKNMELWSGKDTEPTYAVYDAAMGGYIQYKEGTSRGAKAASGTLNMHQGFIVRTSSATTVTFTNSMRSNTANGATFREEQPAFPLINLTVTDDEGVNDFAVLELGRDNDEGAEKLRANDCKGWLYLRHGDNDYGILFRTEVEDYQPLWFEADEAGTFTLSWEPMNADFESLTLIDNIAGEEKDMLTHSSYTFEANPDQYASRFKIIIGDWKDVDEYEDGPSTGSGTFAYQSGDEIIVNGEGRLEVVDVTGRVIVSRDGVHTVSTNGIVPGVYLLRLTNGKETRIQKIIIK